MFFIDDLELCFLDNGQSLTPLPMAAWLQPALRGHASHPGAESAHKTGQRGTRNQDKTLGSDFKAKP
jgi:hypothetical protein